ncbi:MAG TPA: undecaprenyl-phosphate glucose phosphotransferase [Polyangiaceae bacterium]|nr:undecaprenyl-phosphate glucose phosphotransferase [Polyangiaceae bacterium]
MLKRYQHTVGYVFRLVDALVVVVAWLASYWVRFIVAPIAVTKGFPEFSAYAALAPLIGLLWMGVLAFMHVYESHRMLSRVHEVKLILNAHGMALLLLIAFTYFSEEYKYSRLVMIYFAIIGGGALVAFRLVLRNVLCALRARGFNLRHVLAVGEGPALESMLVRLEMFPELGLRVAGVATHKGERGRSICGKAVLGSFDDVSELLRVTQADEVLIALPPSQSQQIDRLLDLLKDETLDIRMVPDVHRYVTLGCETEDFDGVPVVRINDSPMSGWGAISKRVTDFVLSAVGLLLLAPFLVLIGVLVKATSSGPVLYTQERMGLDGRSFAMLKFRSMRADAESSTGAVWAQAKDDRRTAFGTFLRKTSLDELPQLWNVLCGDMSLVGPRPERPVFVHRFRKEIPHYMLRHKVRAGITGWAQINGWRGNTSLDRRVECDLFYIRNWSYGLDLKILLLTLWKGFIHKNAY